MLRFRLFGFPVSVHVFFWLSVAFIGGVTSTDTPQEMQRLLGFIVVAFVSILIHELGHAFTMRHYGDRYVSIMLYAFGGAAQPSQMTTRKESFVISAAGPFAQTAAGVIGWWVLDLWQPQHWLAASMLGTFVWVSIFWALLNLVPIIPLDGGRMMLALCGPRKEKAAYGISILCAIGLGLFGLMKGYVIGAVFCGMFAYENVKRLREGQPGPLTPPGAP